MLFPRLRQLTIALGLAYLLLLISPMLLRAQTNGTISGFVKDPTGAVVPGAKITAMQIDRGISVTTVTNDTGFYNFPALQPGTYTLTVEKTGFDRYVREGVGLTVNQNVRVDAVLRIGVVTRAVTVTAAAPLVDTTSATVSGLVDDRRVVDLPLNGRNVIGLAGTVPGVLSVSVNENMTDIQQGPTMDVNGRGPGMNFFTFDGGYLMFANYNTGINYPPPDAVREFRIQTASFDAQYGHNTGSQVTVVSKAGTNEFHGDLWEFLRNDALNARNFFSPTVPVLKQSQFGATAGGPIKKDKLFFFGSYQGLRVSGQAVPMQTTVPSAAERSGDFTSLLPKTVLTDPINTLTGQPITDASGKLCVAENIINPNCLSPVANNLLKFVPQSPSGTVVSLGTSPNKNDNFFGRIDWNLSPRNTIFGHVYVDHDNDGAAFAGKGNIAGYDGVKNVVESDMITLNDTWTISPTLVNQALISYLRAGDTEGNTLNLDPSTVGINLPHYNTVPPGGPLTFLVTGWFNLGAIGNVLYRANDYQFRDVLTWVKGSHNFQFGGEYLRPNNTAPYDASPAFTFNGVRSGNPMSDFMLGAYGNLGVTFGSLGNDLTQDVPSLFFQDEFKVRPRFTLTYGVRWDPNLQWVNKTRHTEMIKVGAQSTVISDAPPGLLFPGDPGIPASLVPSNWFDFAPRLGLAWDVRGNGKTAVRASYGVFFETGTIANRGTGQGAPYSGTETVNNGDIADPFGSLGLSPPPVAPTQFGCVKVTTSPGYSCPLFPLPINTVALGSSMASPYVQEASVTIQQQVTPNTMVEAGYIGNWGIHQVGYTAFDPAIFVPGTTYNAATGLETTKSTLQNETQRTLYEPGILGNQNYLTGSPFRSWYNSFYTRVTRRMSRGLSVTASYTLAKSIDQVGKQYELAPTNDPLNLRSGQGRSDFDRRHAFVASYLWSLPFRFNTRWANRLLGNWTVSGITALQSGPPISFLNGLDSALDGTHRGIRPPYAFLSGQAIALNHSNRGAMVQEFFNTGAFLNPRCGYVVQPGNAQAIEQQDCTPFGYKYSLLGKYGSAGRGILSGPALSNTDFAILKDFPINETRRFEFRAEAFNVFNQVNFDLPDSTVTDSNFGRLTRAASGREIQFALKFYW